MLARELGVSPQTLRNSRGQIEVGQALPRHRQRPTRIRHPLDDDDLTEFAARKPGSTGKITALLKNQLRAAHPLTHTPRPPQTTRLRLDRGL